MDWDTNKQEKRKDAFFIFYESVLKPDHELRQDAHDQKCYHELLEWRGEIIAYLDRRRNEEFLMTSPIIQPDQTYEKQRLCRMQDAIDDYLQDDKVSPRQAYEEMLSCVDDVIKYHENHYVRARQLRDLMTGYGERNLIPDRY